MSTVWKVLENIFGWVLMVLVFLFYLALVILSGAISVAVGYWLWNFLGFG